MKFILVINFFFFLTKVVPLVCSTFFIWIALSVLLFYVLYMDHFDRYS